MEDISRELEKEIAQSKPKPHKHDRKSRVLIVDDFGEMKSGDYLKTLARVFFYFTVVGMISTGILFYLYSDNLKKLESNYARLVSAEKEIKDLINEKEVLMAKLVISGNTLAIISEAEIEKTADTEIVDAETVDAEAVDAEIVDAETVEEKRPLVSKIKELKSTQLDPIIPVESSLPSIAINEKPTIDPELKTTSETSENLQSISGSKIVEKTVSIEKFIVTKDGTNGDLLVRFDIRNISKNPGDVSGRIFTVLKPENKIESQWLVVPTAPLKNGIPSAYRKGQYFSIAHFKPVKFRIKNQSDPDFFKKASIFIFNNQGDLIFEKLIDVTEAE